jgi:hypothetical protein
MDMSIDLIKYSLGGFGLLDRHTTVCTVYKDTKVGYIHTDIVCTRGGAAYSFYSILYVQYKYFQLFYQILRINGTPFQYCYNIIVHTCFK